MPPIDGRPAARRAALALCALVLAALAALGAARAPLPAAAQTALGATPDTVTVNGILGQPQQRLLVITPGSAITLTQVLISDFVRDDNGASLTGLVTAGELPASVEVGRPFTMTLGFAFDRAGQSGTYTGNLLLTYVDPLGTRESLRVPITATIKDPPVWPFLTLLAGVAISWLLSRYLSRGRPRDELRTRIGQSRRRIGAEPRMIESFKRALRQQYAAAEQQLQVGELQPARDTLKAADDLELRWVQSQEEWLTLAARFEELRTTLDRSNDVPARSGYADELRRRIADALDTAAALAGPAELQARLNEIIAQINAYKRIATSAQNLDKIYAAAEAAAPAEAQAMRAEVDAARRALVALPVEPGDPAQGRPQYDQLDQVLTDLKTRLKALLPASAPESALLEGGRKPQGAQGAQGAAAAAIEEPAAQLPASELAIGAGPRAAQLNDGPAARLARWLNQPGVRLGMFELGSFLIFTALLAGIGFGELYTSAPTFGTDPWRDYLGLLAWGFTTEAARNNLTGLARQIGPVDEPATP